MDMETIKRMKKASDQMTTSTQVVECKLRVGKFRKLGKLRFTKGRIEFHFGYWKGLNEEIKSMEGHRYHGFEPKPRKIWSVVDSPRNRFQLAFMQGEDPYSHYDQKLVVIKTERPLYDHQGDMLGHTMTYHYVILACEMGTGKTLVFIEAAERSGLKDGDIWYVGPKAGVKAVSRELLKWKSTVKPEMMTYAGMKKRVKNWIPGTSAPKFICFDECSKLKTPTSQQSQSALHLANAMREEHGVDGSYLILMSGTPAPRTPIDWWHQCEVACPGFIKEGTVGKFTNRLRVVEYRENTITGGRYPHPVTWRDDPRKCQQCGQMEGHPDHATINRGNDGYHRWRKSRDEISYLYERMKGLVLVKFKKDCLDLPDKQYEIIRVKPTPEIIRAARLIQARSSRAITALTLTREISDGFQYVEVASGTEQCPNCHGKKEVEIMVPLEDVDILAPQKIDTSQFERKVVTCDNCGGVGEVTTYSRDTDAVGSPKDQVFIDDLDSHEDVGRYIVWGGFTGTLDRLVGIAHQQGWATLRVDGKGYIGCSARGEKLDADILLDAMDRSHPNRKKLLVTYPKLCFVGHPQAGGMALTLTASPTELFYSNCYNGEARMQAEDRGHRLGMDKNRGLTIKDIIMLGTDKLVLDNLKKKKKMQDLTMGQLSDAFTSA